MLTQEWVSCAVGSKNATKEDIREVKEEMKKFVTKEELHTVVNDAVDRAVNKAVDKLIIAFSQSGIVNNIQSIQQDINIMQPSAYVDQITEEVRQEQSEMKRRNGFQLLE